jgi:lipopolysaccharide export system permease protein
MHRAKKDVWMKQDNLIIHIKYFNPLDKTIAGIILTELDNKFNIIRRIDAQSGMYTEPTWLFSKVIEQIYDKTNLDYVVKTYKNKEYILNFLPKDIAKIVKKSDEMTMFELLKYVKKIEDEGYDATSYRVDFFAKTASPVVCLIMAMIGAAVGMRSLVKENMPAGIALGIGISFFYYIMHGFCISLGYGKVLPAFLSAWVTNIFFFIFAMLFLISIDD